MRRKNFSIAVAMVAALSVSGCITNPTRQDVGGVAGAITGGLLGSQIGGGSGRVIASVIGGVAGWYIGGQVGRYMDDTDRERSAQAAHQSFENTTPMVYNDSWQNERGHRYQTNVETRPQYYDHSRNVCKQFTQRTTVYIDGRSEQAVTNGIACREYDQAQRRWVWRIKQ